MVEVNKPYSWTLLASLAVLANAGVFKQQIEEVAVVLDQAGAGKLAVRCLIASSI
jgi:hypothetical protein